MNERDKHARTIHLKSRSKKKHSRSRPHVGAKDVEVKVESNSRLQRSRFRGVSMQRRRSESERSSALSSNNINQQQKTKPRQMILSAQVLSSSFNQYNSIFNDTQQYPLSNSITNPISRTNNSLIQNDVSVKSKDKNNKKKPFFTRRKTILLITVIILLILIIILSVVLPLKLKNSQTTPPNQSTQDLACTSGGIICSTPLFHWNYYCDPISYNYYSCCYLSPSSTQLTIEFQLQEDSSYWSIDDISATQNNGELIVNGGFESNLTGWILAIPANATSATYVQNQMNGSHTGSAYLYGGSKYAPADLKQTFNVIQGQNINISFWWADGGSPVYIPGKICQANVIIS